MRFEDLVDREVMTRLCEGFSALTGTTTVLIDLEGKWLASSRSRAICSMYHRALSATAARCVESDAELARSLSAGQAYALHSCRNGLVDVAVPVFVGGERVASFYAGQFFLEPPDRAAFERQARTFGFDARAYLSALDEVPVIPRERVPPMMQFFSELARVIGELGLARSNLEEASRATAASEALLRTVTDCSPDLVFLKDREGRWKFANPAAVEFLGRSLEEVLGKTDREILQDEETVEAIEAVDREVMRDGVRRLVREHVRTARGARLLLASKAPHRDLSGNVVGIVGNASDITEQQRLEEQAREGQKLESIGRLAGGVAHDFNNLLTVIIGCVEAMRHDGEDGRPMSLEDLAEIDAAAKRARDLTRQLLAFARKQVIAPVSLDLNAALRQAEKLLRRILGEDVALSVVTAAEPVPIHCDPGQLEQVLVNLAANARDAMPRGGRLTVEVALVAESPGPIHGSGGWGSWARLRVSDTGCGMSPDVRDKVFEPFFTTKESGKGTGLGLATVHGIVSQNGGRILVESEPGRGTRFEIYLPCTDEPVAARSPGAKPEAQGGRESLLVVEDDPQVRAVIARTLRSAGYEVQLAESGGDAIEVVGSGRTFDLVVSDVIMPGPDGCAILDELRKLQPGLKALFVSGYGGDRLQDHLASGAELLSKPFTALELLGRVRRLLDEP